MEIISYGLETMKGSAGRVSRLNLTESEIVEAVKVLASLSLIPAGAFKSKCPVCLRNGEFSHVVHDVHCWRERAKGLLKGLANDEQG
jgi:hypothetical protein